MADLMGEGHHCAFLIDEKVGAEGDFAGAFGMEEAEGFAELLQAGRVAGEAAEDFNQLRHLDHGHLVGAAEDDRHRPTAVGGPLDSYGLGIIGIDLGIGPSLLRWRGGGLGGRRRGSGGGSGVGFGFRAGGFGFLGGRGGGGDGWPEDFGLVADADGEVFVGLVCGDGAFGTFGSHRHKKGKGVAILKSQRTCFTHGGCAVYAEHRLTG